jgi:hypothetical protein
MNLEHIGNMLQITIKKPQRKLVPGAAKTLEMIADDSQRRGA